MSFNKYFQDELNYLRDLGREFARAYPALGPMLADKGGDPDVERLLEGVAFLTGRIRQKLDDELPELIFATASLLFPQVTRPLPGATILQIEPMRNVLRERRTIARGTEFHSIPIDGTPCRFQSSMDITVSPIELVEARLEPLAGGKQQLRLEFSSPTGMPLTEVVPNALRLHTAGDERTQLMLWLWLRQHVEEIVIGEIIPQAKASEIRLPPNSIGDVGFAEEHALLPLGQTNFPGFRLLQEYYVLPSKFCFVDISGLERVNQLPEGETRFALLLRFDSPLPDIRQLTRDNVRLHCVPVVNVFESTSDPIRVSPERERYLLRPAGHPRGHAEVYVITKAETIAKGSSERVEIPPFYDFSHAETMFRTERVYYTTHVEPSTLGDGSDVYVALGTAENSGLVPDVDVLSVELLATNGRLANAVRAGEITVATPSSPPFATFRNLTAVTGYVPPPLGHDLQWRVLAHAVMNLRSLTELEVLQSALGVYNLHAIVDRQAARANELRISALKSIRVQPAEKLFGGAPVRGVGIDIDVEETAFDGDGDLFLFGSVLERLFASYVSLNSFSRMSVHGVRANTEFSWPARSGNLTLL